MPLGELDLILMRKRSAFESEFRSTAPMILEQAERDGALVVN